MYYSSSSKKFPDRNQYRQPMDEEDRYSLEIEFKFDIQFNYLNYQGSAVNGLVKISTVLVYFFLFWAIVCQFVRYFFHIQLYDTILKSDQEFHCDQGEVLLSSEESRDRFASKLSYTNMYKN
jgi:hypothetical protein